MTDWRMRVLMNHRIMQYLIESKRKARLFLIFYGMPGRFSRN